MKKTLTSVTMSCCLLAMINPAQADISLTNTIVSDYTLNGISQTQSNPALQVSLDWGGMNGLYAGIWTSRVDFGGADKTSNEVDLYIGKYWQLNDKTGLDVGIAYYSYHGGVSSNDYNYPEAHAKFNFDSSLGNSELNFWFTNNYGNLGANHSVVVLAHKFQVAEGQHIRLVYKHSTSHDEDKFAWGGSNNASYDHYRAEYLTRWNGLDINLAAEDTHDIADYYDADSRIVLSVGKTFSF